MHILIVDDEIKIREVVKEYAKVNQYHCDEASNGKQALEMVEKNDYDCVILDIMMPELDGFSACKKIKEIKDTPIIMLSARQEENDKLFCFEMGVDDYVTKPFSPKELMARIKAVGDRHHNKSSSNFIYEDLVVDYQGHTVSIGGQIVKMRPKEIELLFYLIANKNIALDRETLLRNVWKSEYIEDERTLDTHIKTLRKSLGKYRNHIVTVRGMGYKFEI